VSSIDDDALDRLDAFAALARRQRAHRAFRDEPVDDATIDALLTTATFAPSAENSQPWVFVVVRDAHRRARLGDLMARVWQASRDYSRERLEPHLFADVDAGLGGGGIAAAPVLVVVCADLARMHPSTLGSSVFPAVQNLLLAATAAGLGSALTTIATAHTTALRDLLDLPPDHEPVAVVPIGHPARPLGPARRQPPTVLRR
jgi:nitroreductase